MDVEVRRRLVERFWSAMADNDFRAASQLLHDDFLLEWPQSGERIRGRENFVAVNEHYPASGPWRFTLHRLIAGQEGVVTDVSVTDGSIHGRALTFSEVDGKYIVRQVEYWPDPFEAPGWRSQWVEHMTEGSD